MAPRSWIAIVATLASLVAASWPDPPLTGRDFDFSADFRAPKKDGSQQQQQQQQQQTKSKSGGDTISFSTQKRPEAGSVVQADPALYTPAVITMLRPGDSPPPARYTAFFEISYIPTADTLDDVVYSYPWIMSNLTVDGGSGELAPTADTRRYSAVSPAITGGEVRNATIQVWLQDPSLDRYISSVQRAGVPLPLNFAISQVFSDTTGDVSYDFPRASIDFKIQNKTAPARCDVNGNGAPIPGVSRGATDCLATATAATAGGTGGPSGTAGSSSSPTSTSSKKNAAAAMTIAESAVYGWLAMAVVVVLVL
ncbi:hypothetical protein V2A60_006444 [Cordyceps javanica]|uniref:Uncharacterized protein n=1 Tax=Cordyceps javanica TaxID=43265 RepID=A0A545V7Y9_9HYPO|nr:hypothetical protein IF1G_03577 [Cordyceps javanica]TQW08988.1 hypothetical protein IF2G_03419 [Cordyceps javanica]